MEMRVDFNREGGVSIFAGRRLILSSVRPAAVGVWRGKQKDDAEVLSAAYNTVDKDTGTALIKTPDGSEFEVIDSYKSDGKGLMIKRRVTALRKGEGAGFRTELDFDLFPSDTPAFEALRYFAPPALYDKNDLDGDGLEDYFHTQKLLYREDRFNYPQFMAYNPEEKVSVTLERATLPAYDSTPERANDSATGEADALFIQKTDIGSMGVLGEMGRGALLCAQYPFYEGDATIGLYISKTVPFAAFWPLIVGESFEVSWRLRCREEESFNDACWQSLARVIRETNPVPAKLPASPEELVRLRLESLNRYYVEKSADEDPNKPAGYVLNCHPQKGEQLENIIQYGFTGQNVMNAYNTLRYGYEKGNAEYVRRAKRVADFFADKIYIPQSGMFYNFYNTDQKKVDFWWTGLLLPLAYARDGKLERLMGPLYTHRKEVIDKLSELKGAYLRCMSEDATALLRIWKLEKQHGADHENWKKAIDGYCDFLLRTQCEDGGWFRAYDLASKPITEPKIWFGTAVQEQKSSTATCIQFLVEAYRESGDTRLLEAAKKAGRFVKEYVIDPVRFCGGVHDSIYAKGQLVDNESILYPMFGMLTLYKETGDKLFFEGAVTAAHFMASWACLWDVPLPKDSTLSGYGFNSIGMGACDTCGAGYVHPFQLMGVAALAEIARLSGERELLEISRLYWQGCNQNVATEKKSWGYAFPGLQEEGVLLSWYAVDDPMFGAGTGFGNRLKGEGNKTCFPWINAVGVHAYWSLMDTFGTTDFGEIYKLCFEV